MPRGTRAAPRSRRGTRPPRRGGRARPPRAAARRTQVPRSECAKGVSARGGERHAGGRPDVRGMPAFARAVVRETPWVRALTRVASAVRLMMTQVIINKPRKVRFRIASERHDSRCPDAIARTESQRPRHRFSRNGRIWVCATTPASAALERAASARTRCGDARAASARACTSKPRVRGSRAVPPVAPTARTPARILVVERASSWRVHPSIVPLSVKKPRVTMPTPVPTDILVRPRVPEAPLRPLPPGALLAASAAAWSRPKMSLDAHADRFFAPARRARSGSS